MSLPPPLEKHIRYGTSYTPGDVYWGLGIENETYVELQGGVLTSAHFVKQHQIRERYSVDYWKIYRAGATDAAIDAWFETLLDGKRTEVCLPLLMNAHSFTKCDRYGEHATLHTKDARANPRFCGATLLEELARVEPTVFQEGRDVWWTFDGDSIEYMTQAFYCAKLEDVLAELLESKTRWMAALRRGLAALDRELALQKTPAFVQKNYGLAVFLTNRHNVGIFNNGTFHFNITLPTQLDKDSRIANSAQFRKVHQNAARMFQWISPFFVARFGSGDVFASLTPRDHPSASAHAFPAGSQRLCASRYVSIGTYDTDAMPAGKILTLPRSAAAAQGGWYDRVYANPSCSYTALPEIGLDINFQKHWNHGLEFRIFDWFPESELDGVLRVLIWMCDEANRGDVLPPPPNPKTDPIWNAVTARVVWEGTDALLTEEEAARFRDILHVPLTGGMCVSDAYAVLWTTWRRRWNWSKDTYTATMIRTPLAATSEDLVPIAFSGSFILPSETTPSRPTGVMESVLCEIVATTPTTLSVGVTTNQRRWWCC